MAKKQYLISKEPRPMFPAFNPAIIETQASGFAVQQAQEIINSGVFPQGTNLLRYAKDDGSSYWEGFGAVITEKNGIIHGLSAGDVFPRIANPIGEYITALDMSSFYTLSFYVRGNKTENRLLLISDGGGQDHITPEQQYNIPITTYWTHYTLTFIPRIQINTTILLQIYTSIIWGSSTEDWTEIRDLKFEKGSAATDWTPSPYDIVATYDASNFNPLTIKVVPGEPNEGIAPVVVGVAAGKEGKYEGDIANVAKRLFINVTKDAPFHDPGIDAPITLAPKIDYNLRADLSVENIGSYTALNAVRQFGGKLNLSKVFFAVNGSVVQYPGYPLSVALVNGDFDKEGENTLLIVAGDNLGITQEPHIVLDIPQGTEKLQAVNLSTEASDEVAITSGCIADNPFYVRWINTIGGYDYYMFNARKQFIDERTDTVNVQRADISDESDTQLAASFKIERRITTGIDNLNRQEYTKLAGIIRSPRVQWWNEESQTWVTILCGDQSNTWDTNSGLGSIEVTFIYPRILLQQ